MRKGLISKLLTSICVLLLAALGSACDGGAQTRTTTSTLEGSAPDEGDGDPAAAMDGGADEAAPDEDEDADEADDLDEDEDDDLDEDEDWDEEDDEDEDDTLHEDEEADSDEDEDEEEDDD